jgi:tetratricopeptide (TPR) repeat protein
LNTLTVVQIAVAVALLATFSVLAWKQRAKYGYGLVGWFWFLGTLVPVIGFVQVGEQAMADRYAYLPAIGIFLVVVWGCADLVEAKAVNSRVAPAIAIAVVAGLAVLTTREIGYWESSKQLWSRTLEVTQNNFIADDIMGHLLLEDGQPDAVRYFEDAAKVAPVARYRAHIHAVLGITYSELGDYQQARENFRLARSIDPQELQDMIRKLSDAVAGSPAAPGYWRIGLLLEGANQIPEAKAAYEKALQLDPKFSPARTALEGLRTSQR